MRKNPGCDWGFRDFDDISAWVGELRKIQRSSALKTLISALHQLGIELDAIEDMDDDEDADADEDIPLVVNTQEASTLETITNESPALPNLEAPLLVPSATPTAASIKVTKPVPPPTASTEKPVVTPAAEDKGKQPASKEDEVVVINGVPCVVNLPPVSFR